MPPKRLPSVPALFRRASLLTGFGPMLRSFSLSNGRQGCEPTQLASLPPPAPFGAAAAPPSTACLRFFSALRFCFCSSCPTQRPRIHVHYLFAMAQRVAHQGHAESQSREQPRGCAQATHLASTSCSWPRHAHAAVLQATSVRRSRVLGAGLQQPPRHRSTRAASHANARHWWLPARPVLLCREATGTRRPKTLEP